MAPDYNPDREGHTEKRFIVQDATRAHKAGLQTSRGHLEFNREGRMVIKDEALAREIQTEYPTETAVSRVRRPAHADRGHRYFFGQMPEMPWHRAKQEEAKEIEDNADPA